MRKGGSFGFVLLIVVMAVVMLLAAKAWKKAAPTALEIHDVNQAGPVDDRGQPAAGEAVRSGDLPNLGEMKESTNEHAQQVEAAMAAIE